MRLAVIAGDGDAVSEVLEHIKDREPVVITLSSNPSYPYHYRFSPGEVGKILKVLERERVDSLFFIGKVERMGIFGAFKMDLTALKLISGLRSFSDDAILNKVVEVLEERGIRVLDQKEVLKDFVAPSGVICGRLSKEELEDVEFGFGVARKLGELGIGQTVVVKKKSVIAVEAIEGTDATIKRAGEYVKDFVVVKVKRPGQTTLMDLPVVGLKTLEVMKASKGKVLAVEAGATLILGRGFRKKAKEYGIKVVGVDKGGLGRS